MNDNRKTKEQLIQELEDLRRRIAELEKSETERKRVEEVLKRSEEYFRAITENSLDIILVVDKKGTITYTSPSVDHILGYKPEELIGKRSLDLIVPDDFQKAIHNFGQAISTKGVLVPNAFHFRHKDGSERFLEGTGKNLFDNPSVAGFVMNVRDVSDIKKAEETLLSENQFSDSTINSLPGIFYLFDDQGRLQRWNKNFEKVSGYSAEEISRMHPLSLFNGEEKQLVEQAIQKVFTKGENTVEAEFVSKDGRRTPYLLSGVRIIIGNTKCLIGMGIDITDRKRAEEDLHKSEERYRTILEDIDEGYYENDLSGNFTFVNDAECRDLGYSREELIGMNYRQFSNEATAKNLYELFYNIYNTGKPVKRFPEQYISKDGTRHFNEVSASLIRDAKGNPIGFRGVSRDITDRKQAEEAVRESEERYRLVVKNANEAIIIVQDETIKFFNPKALEIYGYSSDENPPPVFSFIEFIHPEDREIVLERYQKRLKGEDLPHVYQVRMIDRQGNIRWAEINSILISWKGRPATLVFLNDIKERKEAEEALKTLSLRDDLTGLFNRRGFFPLAKQGLKTAQRMGTEMLLIFGDLDNLKGINDTFGHKEGDQALMDISQILKDTFRESDIIARIGGDEFVILAMNSFETSSEKLISRFEQVLNDHPLQTKRPYKLSLSLGITYFNPQNPCSIEVLLTEADKIMYENKQKKSR